MIKEYYEMLEKNEELFRKARDVAREIKRRALEIFGDCEVYLVGSYAKGNYTLSSDLDILIVSDRIPERINFEWYCHIVKKLTDDHRINIHLVNRKKFEGIQKMYSPRLPV